jgi:hypothetical protein
MIEPGVISVEPWAVAEPALGTMITATASHS